MSKTTSAIRSSFTNYTVGFVLSVGLTLAAYIITEQHVNSGHLAYSHESITVALMVFAVAQLTVQLYFFLHLGSEAKPKWNVVTFLFMLLIVLIVGVGSLWIMKNLDYNMMQGHDMDHHMMEQSEKGF